jgi:hypothetical protein
LDSIWLLINVVCFFSNVADMTISIGGPRGGTESTTKDIYGGKLHELILFSKLISEYLRKIVINTRICSFGSNIQIFITSWFNRKWSWICCTMY